jgi:N4-gp56 family major capsid protein
MANTSSINSELFANLVVEAQMAAYETSVIRQIATVFDAPVNAGKVLQVPVWDSITASGLTEGTAASAANTNTTQVTITLGEIGVYHQITDMLRDSAYSDVAAQIGDAAGRAIAEKMDADAFGLFSSFGTDVGPGAGGELTVDHILRAAATLRSRKLVGPFYAVITPGQAYNIKKALTATTAYTANTNAGNRVLDSFYVGQIAGVTIIESPLLTIDSSDDAVGGVFVGRAIGTAMRGTLTYEATRQAQNRATDLMVTAVTGQGLLNTTYGVKLTADSLIN